MEEGWLHSPAAGWDEDKYVQFPVLTRISYVGNNSRCSSSSCTSGTKEANAWQGAVRVDAFTMGLISTLFSPRKRQEQVAGMDVEGSSHKSHP